MADEERLMVLEAEVAALREQVGVMPLSHPKAEVTGGRCLSAELKTGETLGRGGTAIGYLVHYVAGTGSNDQTRFVRSSGEITIWDIGKPGSTTPVGLTGGKIPTNKAITGPAALDVTPVDTFYRLIGFDCDQLDDV